jgi:hypothetical protein
MNSHRIMRDGVIALVALVALAASLSADAATARARSKRRPKTASAATASNATATSTASGSSSAASSSSSSSSDVSNTSSSSNLTSAQGQLTQTVSVPAPVANSETGFSGGISSEYYPQFRDGQETFTDILLDLGYRFDDKNSVKVLQPGRVIGVVSSEDPTQGKKIEYKGADTMLRYGRVLAKGAMGWDWGLRTEVTLPVSKGSVANHVISRPTLMVLATRKFFAETLTLSYRPYYTYQINENATGADGKPLPQHFLGHLLITQLKVTDWLSLEGVFQGVMNWDQEAPAPLSNSTEEMGSYLYDFSVGVSPVEPLTLKVGYSQSDAFLKNDKYDVALYNPDTTRYYLAAELSF